MTTQGRAEEGTITQDQAEEGTTTPGQAEEGMKIKIQTTQGLLAILASGVDRAVIMLTSATYRMRGKIKVI
jgi:hypothetical protein